jgi:hypothetical protein
MREHAPRGPRTPRGPHYRSSAAPLYLTSFGRGADLASGARFLAHRVAFCGSSRMREHAPRASRCPPEVGFLLQVVQSARTCPPRLRRCPPKWGDLVAS